jgi:hypothetical protein
MEGLIEVTADKLVDLAKAAYKHAKGGSAWASEPNEHVKALLKDGLRYRWLRGGTTDYTPIFEQALCLEAMDDWIDEQMQRQYVYGTDSHARDK